MKRRLIISGLVGVIVLCLAGIAAVIVSMVEESPTDRKLLYPSPWVKNQRLQPLATADNRQLLSYALAEQIDYYFLQVDDLPIESGGQRRDGGLSFDPYARSGSRVQPKPLGMLAFKRASGRWQPADAKTANFDFVAQVKIYDTAAQASAQLTEIRDSAERVLGAPAIAGLSETVVAHLQPGCPGGSAPDSVEAGGILGETIMITTTISCAPAEKIDDYARSTSEALTKIAKTITPLAAESAPEVVMDQTDTYPILSSGSWSDRRVVITDKASFNLVPAEFRSDSLQVYFSGLQQVLVMDYPGSAERWVKAKRTEETRSGWREHKQDYADLEICTDGPHRQSGTRCYSQVGRFVVVSRGGSNGPDPREQAELLR